MDVATQYITGWRKVVCGLCSTGNDNNNNNNNNKQTFQNAQLTD